ncbi:MAG: hypothetical protein Q9193_002462 [Seirophora villosa]
MQTEPVAQLLTINIGRLEGGEEHEAAQLFKAAKEDGVFYADLQESGFEEMLATVEEVFALAKALFDLSMEEKMQYDIDELGELKLNGYKPVGRNFGGNEYSQKPRRLERKRHLDPALLQPSPLTTRLPTLTSFFDHTHKLLALLLSSLCNSLGPTSNVRLTDFHRTHAPSPDILRLLHYIAQPSSETGFPQAPHTDLGSLTMLFVDLPGLQVIPAHGTEWAYVLPKPKCAIVNIGDGM